MLDLSQLFETLQLSTEKESAVQNIIAEFLALNCQDQTSNRLAIAEKVFSLAFYQDVILRASDEYTKLKETTWSTNCQLTPGIITTPRTSEDVAKILALCVALGLTFSVRGGGHLHNVGFTSNDGGVLISLSKLTNLTISDDRATTEFGPGLTWLEVYGALHEYGVTVPGGRVPSVGVAGLLLGGGISFQNSEYGLSCNSVLEYEVVLADSRIVKVNASENSDLFWALKGGGSNFGIVTKFKMETIPNDVWAEGRVYSPANNKKLLEAVRKYSDAAEKDNKATIIWHSISEATLVVLFYCRASEKRPVVFNAFEEIPFLIQALPPGSSTVYDVINGFASVNGSEPKSHGLRTMTSLPDIEVYNAAEEARLEQLEKVKHIPGAVITMVVQPISHSTIEACRARGGNTLGLDPRSQQWFLLMTDWSNPEDEAAMSEASRKIVDCAEATAKKNGTFLDFKYSNYASKDQNPLTSYGAESLTRLKSIATSFDPTGVFQKLQNDGFLVSKTD